MRLISDTRPLFVCGRRLVVSTHLNPGGLVEMTQEIRQATIVSTAITAVSALVCIISSISLIAYPRDQAATIIRAISGGLTILFFAITVCFYGAHHHGTTDRLRAEALEVACSNRLDELD